MGSIPQVFAGGRVAAVGVDAANSGGTLITAGSPAHTKGSWVQIVASTAFASKGLVVSTPGSLGTLVDIAIGASGSEKVIAANLRSSGAGGNSYGSGALYHLPLQIPAGTRIAARCQDFNASYVSRVGVTLLAGGVWPGAAFSRLATYGANTAATGGTNVDPGGTVHTKGSWTQLTSGTSFAHRALLIGIGDTNDSTSSSEAYLLDIAVGASGSERVILPDLHFRRASTGAFFTISTPVWGPFPVNIPANTRIAARCQCSGNTANSREIDVSIYAL